MDNISKMRDRIEELELHISNAIEQLHSLANEQVHRQHGCLYQEVSIDDLEEVISILKGIK